MTEKATPCVAGSPALDRHAATGRIHRTIRSAIYAAAHGHGSLKELAGDLDFSPSNLSACTILGEGEHVRPFPAERLGDLCRLTGDVGPLLTLADELGYVCVRREELHADAADLDRIGRRLRGER